MRKLFKVLKVLYSVALAVALIVFLVKCHGAFEELNESFEKYSELKTREQSREVRSIESRAAAAALERAESRRAAVAAIAEAAQFAETRQAAEQDELVRIVEREIRKHDPWVEEVLAADSAETQTSESRGAQARVRLRSRARLPFGVAAYSPGDDVLIVTNSENAEVADSIDHELWHAFFDGEGERGFYFRSGVSAPALGEIGSYAARKAANPGFKSDALIQILVRQFRQLRTVFQKGRSLCNDAVVASDYDLRKNAAAHLPEFPAELEERGRRWKSAFKEQEAWFTQREEDLEKHWDDLFSRYENRDPTADKTVHLAEIEQFFAEFGGRIGEARERFRSCVALVRGVRACVTEMLDAHARAQVQALTEQFTRELDAVAADRVRETVPENAGVLDAVHRSMAQVRDMALAAHEISALRNAFAAECDALDGELREFGDRFRTVTDSGETASEILNLIGDSNEVMARIVDSLYSLYFGPVGFNKFPLAEADIQFLERFTFQGAPIFRKGIERYRLGRDLIREGMAPEEAKRALEYATGFTHNGKTYHWPEANVSIAGSIPRLELTEDGKRIKR